MDARQNFLEDALGTLRRHKQLAEGAIAQLSDEQLAWAPDEDANSVAILVQHVAGNLRSRWSEYLASDGEKDDRQRDQEFLAQGWTREQQLARWEEGWSTLFQALEPLGPEDLTRSAPIRGKQHTVVEAVLRQLGHYAYHVGQIVQLARQLVGPDEWRTLSIAKGESSDYRPEGRI
ncbi:MAG: DUF1572 family protein [Planctomycetota bacterium]|nr:DUF1572 family protein [Planctomycetota bacterium]